MKRKNQRSEHSVLQTVEQATDLLRRVSARAWVWWFGGTAPFACAMLYFWTDMSRAADGWDRLPGSALLLAVAYAWMKVAHCFFCDHLMRHLRGEEHAQPLKLRGRLRLVSSQALIHCTAPWLLVLALAALLPFGWVYAFYHNVTALAVQNFRDGKRTRDLIRTALLQSNYRQGSNHGLMMTLFVFAVMLWFNGWNGLIQVSLLLRSFTGEENLFTTNIWTLMSSTVMAITALAAYMLAGPLVKAIYTLRCFYGLARKNGEDLLVAFRATRAATLVITFFLALGLPRTSLAQPVDHATAPRIEVENAKVVALDQRIHEVLQQSEFQWRLPRSERPPENSSWVANFIRDCVAWLTSVQKDAMKTLEQWLKELLKGLFDSPMRPKESASGTPWADLSVMIMKILLIILGFVLAVLLLRHWLRSPPGPPKVAAAAAPPINLESDHVVATLLPEQEWLKLAQEKMDAGDFRLAMRALFLATLAHLGERKLLGIRKSKSNGDYVRELSLRARDRSDLRQTFGDSVRVFDWAWYGLHDVTRELLEQFRANHQRITTDGSPT